MVDDHKNFPYSTVASAPSPNPLTGTTLDVAAGGGLLFPTPPFNASVWPIGQQALASNAEIVRVTNITVDTLTITRAQEGSSARSILVGDQIAATITDKTLTDIENLVPTHEATYAHGDIAGHIADATDAHDASAISLLDTANDFTATDVEGALDELQADNEAHVAAANPHAAVKLYKHITVESPTNAEDIPIFIEEGAITITKVYTFLRGGTSVTFNIKHGTNPASPASLYTSDQVANTLTSIQTHSTTYNDASVASLEGSKLTTSAVSGTVVMFHVTIQYTRD